MSSQTDAARIEELIRTTQLAKALWSLRDAFARSPRDARLLQLAAKLAQVAESRAHTLGCNKATEDSRQAEEMETIAREARDYLQP